MAFNFRNPLRRAWPRRLLSGMTLIAYFVAGIGFPVPLTAARSANAGGEQVCGCGSAEACKASGCGCAPARPPADCCAKKAPSACCARQSNATPTAPAMPKKSRPAPVKWVVGISALKCRGGSTEWISSGAALPGAPPLTWQPSWPFCYTLPVTHRSCLLLSADLVDPPPRLEAV